MGLTYRDAGVDIDAAERTKRRIRELVRSTFGPEVLSDIGLFGGLFMPDLGGYEEPVLVASTDGVGTKLKVAFLAGRHDTVGVDLVHHCANDIVVQGARPIFFLDYLAMGEHREDV
ncbi:MAG: phosphoribosylformylglycinamidine cyclo-ligase, partial [Candidatus Latescibacterota bacterium]